MSCAHIKTLIPLYIDGALGPSENTDVKQHLVDCPACQNELSAYQRSWQMLKELPDIEPASGFVSRFWTNVALQESWQEKWSRHLKEIFVKKSFVTAVVTACLFIVTGLFVFKNYTSVVTEYPMAVGLHDQDNLEMIENIDLAENYDVIEDLDFWEDVDAIEHLDSVATDVS